MKVFGFVETDHLRAKVIINDETLEQVSQFTYLGCSISYQFSNDVELKLAKFLQLIGTINPLPVQFKSLLPGQEGCVFSSGHLNTRTCHYVLLR
jgi:hypothetical protein